MIIGRTDLAQDVYVIAEIGGNHNGDPEAAYRLVEAAAKAGANGVKFQTYRAETLVHPSVEPVPLVKRHYKTQLERFRSLELAPEVYERIIRLCAELGVDFLTTPFDLDILERFAPLMPAIKIASGDLTWTRLIRESAAQDKPVLLSTGMSTLDEVAEVRKLVPAERLALLHCVSVYPTPDAAANLNAITVLKSAFPEITIGYSDHTKGFEACLAAVALGARVIEKHFTLDTAQVPGDHVLSVDPAGLAAMVAAIRRVNAMLGEAAKRPAEEEAHMRKMMRRGVYAARHLPAGTVLAESDISVIRPANGVAPEAADHMVGRRLTQDVGALEPLSPDSLTAP